ncbi:hypothetical protein BP00DRAFT_127801, partial [Aspergillus indologenus CBS 114.80]
IPTQSSNQTISQPGNLTAKHQSIHGHTWRPKRPTIIPGPFQHGQLRLREQEDHQLRLLIHEVTVVSAYRKCTVQTLVPAQIDRQHVAGLVPFGVRDNHDAPLDPWWGLAVVDGLGLRHVLVFEGDALLEGLDDGGGFHGAVEALLLLSD